MSETMRHGTGDMDGTVLGPYPLAAFVGGVTSGLAGFTLRRFGVMLLLI